MALTLLVVPPVLLMWLMVEHRPAAQDVAWRAVERPLSSATLIVAVVIGGGVLWCVLAVGVLAEIRSRLSGRVSRLRLPTRLQAAASGLLGAYLLATAASQPSHHPPATTSTPNLDSDTHRADPTASASVEAPTPTASSSPVGIDLTDGSWLPQPVTDAVTAAAGAIWWRRRRDYQPDPRGATRDLGLDPLPPTVAAIQALTTPGETSHETQTSRPEHLMAPADLPPGGIALTGDGATAAARGLLVTLVLAHPRPDADAVVTTTATLDLILPERQRSLTFPGVREVATVADVIAVLEAADTAPPTVLAAAGSLHDQRLADAVTAAKATAVVLGSWTYGDDWHVDLDGHVSPHSAAGSRTRRLCVLTPRAATDLLHLVHMVGAEPLAGGQTTTAGSPASVGVPKPPSARSPPSC
ncbi:hypothetical protein AB0J82_15375 [Asanoa sp. NPDC049518]|uniref:hypothetical protein n=1 Tax=unclassified Asanoa TaxID=2685164 RepID=UPI003421B788